MKTVHNFYKKISSLLADEGKGVNLVNNECILSLNKDRLPADKGRKG